MLNETFQSVVLGIAQGLGEFLPISSTAHLILIPRFFGWNDPGLGFDVALHLGTLIAVLIYFWRDWIGILQSALGRRNNDYDSKTLWLLALGTVPGVLAGYFFEEKAETILRSPILIAFTLSLAGLVLFFTDKFSKRNRNFSEINYKDALLIGISQAIAIIPGVSRSGATITAGLMRGVDRVSAAKFSFLLSTPIIFGANLMQFSDLGEIGFRWSMVWGIAASALSGYLAIKYLIRMVSKMDYGFFFWYRLVIAGLIVLFLA